VRRRRRDCPTQVTAVLSDLAPSKVRDHRPWTEPRTRSLHAARTRIVSGGGEALPPPRCRYRVDWRPSPQEVLHVG
jgi:hypothetical protein